MDDQLRGALGKDRDLFFDIFRAGLGGWFRALISERITDLDALLAGCPECGHETEAHLDDGCAYVYNGNEDRCECRWRKP